MIELSKVRLINWYGFSNVTVPFGFFTLIAGKNGNGKSVLLDAVKYALYGDTVFNKSTENRGSRTIPSYTRGLLDATAGSCMRPANRMPNVSTHIVLEMYERKLERYFILGTVIETNAADGYVTQRYVLDGKKMEDISHTYTEGQDTFVYNGAQLQKMYGMKMLSSTEGLKKFMQRTGLRLNEEQLIAFRRKLRSIMSYDPGDKIDQFIRKNVLEERKVDFSKLVEAKRNIDALTDTFQAIDSEIRELEGILACFEELKRAENVILTDNIKITYREFLRFSKIIEETARAMELATKQMEEDERKLDILKEKEHRLREELSEAQLNLSQLDCARAIREAEAALVDAEKAKDVLLREKNELLQQQERILRLVEWYSSQGKECADRNVLLALTENSYTGVQKSSAVEAFVSRLQDYRDSLLVKIMRFRDEIRNNEEGQQRCQKLIDDCNARITNYSEIPEYISLKNEINREFEKRGIQSEARFACEYVIGLVDEGWRDVIEGYLGRRRYTILVEPEYYDVADDVLNNSKYRYAHLFNTKLLMKKNIKKVENAAADFIEVKNPVARKYFDYQLGRFHAVDLKDVRNYENAMAKEGRVSVAMDSYFIRFESIRHYYLGQKALEINRSKAEKQLIQLKERWKEQQEAVRAAEEQRSWLETQTGLITVCNYNACTEYEDALHEYSVRRDQLRALEDAQRNNMEYVELAGRVTHLKQELDSAETQMNILRNDRSRQETAYLSNRGEYERAESELGPVQEKLTKYKKDSHAVYEKALADYNRFCDAGERGTGGTLKDRSRAERTLREAGVKLTEVQSAYNAARTAENRLPVSPESQAEYQSRKDRIWMDDRQEISEKLKIQTSKYESIFKNEFVLTILKSCENARADLKLINAELSRLDFRSRYEFEVKYIRDGSDYEKIIEYAKYLKEKESLGASAGQMTLEEMVSDSGERGNVLEKEIRRIIAGIVSGSDRNRLEQFADYRNYMNYEILVSNEDVLNKAKLSRQSGYNSGAEVQIPYMLILLSALLMIYNDKSDSTRLVFIDEPFAKMDPTNVKIMLGFMKEQRLQMVFCAPDKTELIGNECDVILPVLRTRPDLMEIGIVEIHEGTAG
ncbi:MAG: SbcC/MukB-like Walker B domain-containing protein [Anaerovoracaceae bacterium]